MKKILVLCACLISLLLFPSKRVWADSYWLTGGLIGAGVGAGAGVGITYAACGTAEENTSSCRQVAIPLGAVLLGGAGFGLGALIGSAFKKEGPPADENKNSSNNTSSFISPTVWAGPQWDSFGVGAVASF